MVSLGAHPPHSVLFSGESNGAELEGLTGIHRTKDEMEILYSRISQATEEVGGKVRNSDVYPHYVFNACISRQGFCTLPLLRRSITNYTLAKTPSSKRGSHTRSASCGCRECRQWQVHHTWRFNTRCARRCFAGRPNISDQIKCVGGLDDGRGRARVTLFRHKHEIETGRTSSVGMEVCLYILIQLLNIKYSTDIGFCSNRRTNITCIFTCSCGRCNRFQGYRHWTSRETRLGRDCNSGSKGCLFHR